MADTLDLSQCELNFETEEHYECPDRLLRISAGFTHPTLGELGWVSCLRTSRRVRSKDAGDFLEVMDMDSEELQDFSSTLFDKKSHLRPEFVDGGKRSGSGCWGKELNDGEMLYIQDMRVKKEFRRSGVGSCILEKLLASQYLEDGDHAFCWPCLMDSTTTDQAERDEELDNLIAFFRKNGFRRVGLTYFFAYSPDPAHPSRHLLASADPDQPKTTPASSDLSWEEVKIKYPLHLAVAVNKTSAVADIIREAFKADPGRIHEHDLHGFTPLHIAAGELNLIAVRTLLELDPVGMKVDLKDNENDDSITPLEGLRGTMRSSREFMETLVGRWRGYDDLGIGCEWLMERTLDGQPTDVFMSEIEFARRKFGCTCGACSRGWLSPRMKFRLSDQAGVQVDMLRFDLSLREWIPYQPSSSLDPWSRLSAFYYLPPHLRDGIYRTCYRGFLNLFIAAREVFANPDRYKTSLPEAVLKRAQEIDFIAAKAFIAKGGKVEYVLDAVVDIAAGQSPLGDGTWDELFEDEEEEEEQGKDAQGGGIVNYGALPSCANDLEFGIVRRQLEIGKRAWKS